ncbi:D-alanyl-D-alanine carboxypeptidase, partial [Salmonella enterica subsp. enterica serovar Minnesota str. A4-603]
VNRTTSYIAIVTVGRDAWAKDNPVFVGSSLMFLKEGDRVSVRDLSRGLACRYAI